MADPPLVRWRDVLWLVHSYPLEWITRLTPARWLPVAERAAERGFQVARRGAGRRAAARMRDLLGISEDEARSLSEHFLAHSIRVTHLERRLRRSRPDAGDSLHSLDIVGREHLDAALDAKKGALLVMVHRFAVGPVIRAMRAAGYPLLVVINPHPHPMFGRMGRRAVRTSQRRMFAHFYPDRVAADDPEVSVKIVQRLRAGGSVVIAGDARRAKTSTTVRFLNGKARVSAGVLELARVSGSPILPFDALYEPDALRAEIGSPIELARGRTRDDHVELNLPRLVAALERMVAACPDQWMHWADL